MRAAAGALASSWKACLCMFWASRKVVYSCSTYLDIPIRKLFAWGEGDSGGHVLRETTRGSNVTRVRQCEESSACL